MRPHRVLGLLLPLLLLASTAFAQTPRAIPVYHPGAWGNDSGVDPCGADSWLQQQLQRDPALRQRREMFEQLVEQAQRTGMIPGRGPASTETGPLAPIYVIPIAVHIVHSGVPVGTQENLSDNQIHSQIDALNRDFQNLSPLPSALNTRIRFCLATQLPPASPVVWSTTPGITRDVSAQTNHTFGNLASETALKAISYLPADRYLNIWVVRQISGGSGGIAGYGTFPGAGPLTRDGIVMRYDVFGSNTTGWGTFALIASNPDGKILAHEVGHYLNLYHPFQGGCTAPGDFVADTPPEAVNGSGCPTVAPTSCTAAPDPIENYMDYTNDACRYAFTNGQMARMYTAITTYRSLLVSGSNLIYVGCPTGLNALIVASPTQVCAGSPVAFTTPATGPYTYNWQFPGGTPPSATTQSVNVTWASPGTMTATLTVTDTTNANFSTNTQTVYVQACSAVLSHCTNWVFSSACGLSFATGVPVAFNGTQNGFGEAAGVMSSASGTLAFYSNAGSVWGANNAVMPNGSGLLSGISSHNGALAVQRPGSSSQYFLFIIAQNEDGFVANPATYNLIDMSLNAGNGDIVAGQKNLPIALLPAGNKRILEGQTLIPHCNGVDWWLVQGGSETTAGKIWVTLVTSAGPVSTTAYNIGINTQNSPGAISASSDGNRFAMISFYPSQLAVYNFNRSTGVPTVLMPATAVGDPYIDACFSPDGKLLYFATWDYATTYGVRQLQIATGFQRDIATNLRGDVELGPDGKVYLGSAGSPTLSCINFPNNFNTANANECGLNLNSIALGAGVDGVFGALPNTLAQCSNGAAPAAFTYTVTNCTNVTFTALNCSGPYSWNFGDAQFGSGQVVSHNYASPGVYTVTLTVTGASPPTQQQTLALQMSPVTIAGSSIACSNPNNYSAVGPATYTYSWTVSGGAPATATGNNVDVIWSGVGGTIQLTATDPATGCTATVTKTVGPCPSCVAPPLNMVAWFPLDEPTPTVAQEIVIGNNGTDFNAPLHVTGKVHRGRTFNGTNQYVRANDAPQLNFGTGDLSIDAWVRTSVATGIHRIVDKRLYDPEGGYSLYVKNGRLAFRLCESSTFTSTEYWTNVTPFIADGQWHHVAATEKRSVPSTGTRLYVDGVNVATFPAFVGNVNTTEKFYIGAGGSFSGPADFLNGSVDEVELFQRSLSASEILGVYFADSLGKCKEFSYVPTSANICRDQGDVTLTMRVCNYTGATQTYNLTFNGLPAAGPCTFAGPTVFQILSPTPVVVPANSCVNVQYKVTRPVGMPLYATSCYQVMVTNASTFTSTVNNGSLYATRQWCNVIIGGPVVVGGGGSSGTAKFSSTNTGDSPATMPYTISVIPIEPGSAEDPGVALNGLPPGVPYHSAITLAPGETGEIDASALFSEPRAFRYYDIVLSMDDDGDGIEDSRTAYGLEYGEAPPTTDVPPTGATLPKTLRLSIHPNPVQNEATIQYELPERGRVDIGLFDVAGRRVRTLVNGIVEPGRRSLAFQGAGLPRGVYFVRMQLNGKQAGQRLVMVQ